MFLYRVFIFLLHLSENRRAVLWSYLKKVEHTDAKQENISLLFLSGDVLL